MAVYKRSYTRYAGPKTQIWPRFLILTRYSFARLFASKLLVLFIAASLFYPLGCIIYAYLRHNIPFLLALRISPNGLVPVEGKFFYFYCYIQGGMAYLLTAVIGPGLVSPDLANGAMPLYFCRPFSRTQYVLGKMCVLLILLSIITWIPGLVLYAIQSSLEGWDWFTANFWIAESVFIGLFVWILVLSLIALAASAWVKWKIAAGAVILGVFFAGAGFGAAINQVLRTSYGSFLDLTEVIHTIWSDLFRYDSGSEMSLGGAWIMLAVISALCCWLLARRIRPFEVIK